MQSINIKTAMKWLTAEQALKFLGVRSQTLYANVSRGRIRAKPDPADSRRSLYNGNDVARLAERRPGRRPAETVATQAIGWGDPVLPSGISTVANGRLWYRGRDAVQLAESATLEEVAALLWQTSAMRAHADPAAAKSAHAGTPIGRLLSVVSERAAIDPPSRGRSPAVLKSEAEMLFGSASGGLARHGHRPFRLAGAYAPCQSLAQTTGAGYFAKNTCPSGRP